MKRKGRKIRQVRETTYDLDKRLTALEGVVKTLASRKPAATPKAKTSLRSAS